MWHSWREYGIGEDFEDSEAQTRPHGSLFLLSRDPDVEL